MGKRWALPLLGVASLVMLAACLVGGSAAAILFALLAAAFPCLLMLVGAERRGRVGAAARPILALAVLLELAIAGMLLLRGRVLGAPLVLGLPPAAALLVYGVLAAPLVVVALGYAWSFDSFRPAPEDLRRLRAVARGEEGE